MNLGFEPLEPDRVEPTARAALFLKNTPEAAISFLEADLKRDHTHSERQDIEQAIKGIEEGLYR